MMNHGDKHYAGEWATTYIQGSKDRRGCNKAFKAEL